MTENFTQYFTQYFLASRFNKHETACNIFKPASKQRLLLVVTQVVTQVVTFFQYITKKIAKNAQNSPFFQYYSRVTTFNNLFPDLLPLFFKIKQFNGKGCAGCYWLLLLSDII
jgi:hypothetical protein